MKLIEIDGTRGVVEQEGVTRQVRLDFLPEAVVGDYVLVHAGVAIERLDEADAQETLRLLSELTDEVS